jgi:hypothetical protein
LIEPLFHRAYGEALAFLPAPIIKIHDIQASRTWRGEVRVTQGRSLAARALARLLRFPPEGDLPLQLTMTAGRDGEIWERRFGAVPFDSVLRLGVVPGTVEETIWPFTAVSRLDVDAKGVDQVLVGMRLCGIRLPRPLWPKLEVRESADGPPYRFSVSAWMPWGALIGCYEGFLRPD